MPRMTKPQLVKALADAGVETQPSFTVAQLKALYDELGAAGGPPDPQSAVNETIEQAVPEQADVVPPLPFKDVTSSEGSGISESETSNDEEEAIDNNVRDEMERIELARLRRHLRVLRLRKQIREMEILELRAEREPNAVPSASATIPDDTAVPIATSDPVFASASASDSASTSASVIVPNETSALPTAAALAANVHRRIDFSDVEHAIPDFSGDDKSHDVRDFIRAFEDIMTMVRADETYKLLALRRKLKGAAQCLMFTARAVSYDELKEMIVQEFGHKLTAAEAEKLLRRRMWKKKEESLHRYVLEMQKLRC